MNVESLLLSLLGTGFVGGLVATFANQYLTARREARGQRQGASYLALRLSVILEGFAFACHDLISDNDFHAITPAAGTPRTRLPELPPYPDDPHWRSLDLSLAERALSLRNVMALSEMQLAFLHEIEPHDLAVGCGDEAARRGHDAWCLAVQLRRHYRIAAFTTRTDLMQELAVRCRAASHRDTRWTSDATSFLAISTAPAKPQS